MIAYNKKTGMFENMPTSKENPRPHTKRRKKRWPRLVLFLLILSMAFISVDKCSKAEAVEEVEEEVEEVAEEVEETAEDEDEAVVDFEGNIPPFNYQAFRYYRSNEDAEVELKVDFPTGESLVDDAVRKYIHKLLSSGQRCSLSDAQEILDYYGNRMFLDCEMEHNMIYNGDDDTQVHPPYWQRTCLKVECVADKFVTFNVDDSFWSGGAHELVREYGVTFSRANGRYIDYSYYKNLESRAFKHKLKEGLRKYFISNGWEASSDEELADKLQNVDDSDDIPLPKIAPYLTSNGVCFKYSSYEIACFAAGFPTFILPYDEAGPYMSDNLINIIK